MLRFAQDDSRRGDSLPPILSPVKQALTSASVQQKPSFGKPEEGLAFGVKTGLRSR